MKKLLVLISIFLMFGCASSEKIRIRSEVQEIKVPVLYCPKPPEIDRPTLPFHNMTPDQTNNPGEIAKHYKATIQALLGYIYQLEQALQSYEQSNQAYDNLREKLETPEDLSTSVMPEQ